MVPALKNLPGREGKGGQRERERGGEGRGREKGGGGREMAGQIL